MKGLTKNHTVFLELITSWLRSQTATLNNVLDTIERNSSYDDEYVKESIRKVEVSMKQIGKFINAN